MVSFTYLLRALPKIELHSCVLFGISRLLLDYGKCEVYKNQLKLKIFIYFIYVMLPLDVTYNLLYTYLEINYCNGDIQLDHLQ